MSDDVFAAFGGSVVVAVPSLLPSEEDEEGKVAAGTSFGRRITRTACC